MVKEDRSDWVAVDAQFQGPSTSIRPATSAYIFYQRSATSSIRSSLASSNGGVAPDFGAVASAVSAAWRALTEAERRPFEEEARLDRVRFEEESRKADEEKEEERRKRREAQEAVVKEGEKRGANARATEEMEERERAREEASARRVPVEYSAEQLEERAKAKREKEEKEKIIKDGLEAIKKERADQAKKRLDFLLSQSDIFSHFGKVTVDQTSSSKYIGRSSAVPGGAAKSSSAEAYNASHLSASSSSSSADASGPMSPTRRRESFDADAAAAAASSSSSSSSSAAATTAAAAAAAQKKLTTDEELAADGDPEEVQSHYLTVQPATLGNRPNMMRAYQLEGLNWMIKLQEHGVNGILADEMGLGKTLQSISVLVWMKEALGNTGPHLIVVPKSTLSNWMKELERWAPTLRGCKFHGTKEERDQIVHETLRPGGAEKDRAFDVCVTTYEVCNSEKGVLSKFAWNYLIIDEAHRLKNEASLFSQTIRSYTTRFRLLLTGTPLQNNLHELWALLNFLVPDVFASSEQFDEWFNLDIDDAESKTQLIGQLHKILRPFMLRRLKADVEKSLPPKHETILFTGMSAMQKKLYKEILMRDIDIVQKGGTGNSGRTAVLNIVMQLRKAAGHPYLFPGQEDRSLPPLGEHLVENCGKMVLLDKLLTRLKEKGHRVLIFTQMTKILDILEDYVVMRKYKYCRIDGNTSYEQREDGIDAFNRPGSEKFVFLLSTRAGGLGINLQTADTVILFDSDWNPQADLQAQDRAHRIGQKKPVQIFRIVTEHTIEEKIVERAQQKLKLDAMVVQSGRLKDKDKLSNAELLEAIRFGADKVFKSKDSTITDQDIDMILDIGRKKTDELNEKLKVADKGDLLDFKMDSGFNAQTYEGIDYSDAATRSEMLGLFDIGKRERKPVANFTDEFGAKSEVLLTGNKKILQQLKKGKGPKFPPHLKLPSRMDEWHLYDRERLTVISEEEQIAFRKLANDGLLASIGPITPEYQVLQGEELAEKKRLLEEGFPGWGRLTFSAFVKASSRFGRTQYARIAVDVGKPYSEVERYAKAFWNPEIGKKRVSEAEWNRVEKNVVEGEEKLTKVINMEKCTKNLVETFDNPWEEFEFALTSAKDKGFTAEEDRFMLCWTLKYGHGQWEAIRLAIRRCDRFKFDYHLRAMTSETIQKRCEQLMRACEREVQAIQKKAFEKLTPEEQAVTNVDDIPLKKRRETDADARKNAAKNNELNTAEQNEKLSQIEKMLRDLEAKAAGGGDGGAESGDTDGKKKKKSKPEAGGSAVGKGKEKKDAGGDAAGEVKKSAPFSEPKEVPVKHYQELLGLVARGGNSGIQKIVDMFVERHPDVSKRQAQLKIEEFAVRERHEGDARQVWHVREQFVTICDDATKAFIANPVLQAALEAAGPAFKAGAKRKASGGAEASGGGVGSSGDKSDQPPKKKKALAPAAGGGGGGLKASAAVGGPSAASAASTSSAVMSAYAAAAAIGCGEDDPAYDGAEPPMEAKKAFTHFCNASRKSVKATMPEDERNVKDLVNAKLKAIWKEQGQDVLAVWTDVERKDKLRYEKQLRLHEKRAAAAAAAAAAASGAGAAAAAAAGGGGGAVQEPDAMLEDNNNEESQAGASSGFHIPKKRPPTEGVVGMDM